MNTDGRYTLDLFCDGGNTRTFVFGVESSTGRGWVKLKLLEINDTIPLQKITWQERADRPSSYFNLPWSARSTFFDDGERTYELYGAFGTPGGRLLLTPVA
jgi:hypothetical protein